MSDRWEQVKALFHEALDREPGRRSAFLDSACAGDDGLRAQVEALLEADAKSVDMLAPPALTMTASTLPRLPRICPRCSERYSAEHVVCRADGEVLVDDPEALVNTTLDGLYRVLGVLGKGGFGVVYLARHLLLRDHVAIKVLRRRLSVDTDRIERFLREGRAARALRHPNVVAVYDLRVSEDGTTYMVQEYVEGRTLRDELELRGRLPADEALDVLAPIAAALDEVHAHGIVHRDLKPENIMLGSGESRAVKLLDLGIAKLKEILVSAMAEPLGVTQPGQIIGTPHYMPPEQWGERPKDGGPGIDARADVYSLGVVVSELVSGRRPFEGSSYDDVREAHLRSAPRPVREVVPELPEEFERTLERAMAKDRADRPASAGELILELQHALAGEPVEPLPAPPPALDRRIRIRVAALAVFLFVVAGVVAWYLGHGPAVPRAAAGLTIEPITRTGKCVEAAISPDGKYVVTVVDDAERRSLELRQVGVSSGVIIVPPTTARLSGPRFSADGYVYYVASTDGGADKLFRVPVLGGLAQLVSEKVSSTVSVSPDGRSLAFVRLGPVDGQQELLVANDDGTNVRSIAVRTAPAAFEAVAPAWSPDGGEVACSTSDSSRGRKNGIVVIRVSDRTERELTRSRWYVVDSVVWPRDGDALVVSAQEKPLGPLRLFRIGATDGVVTSLTSELNNYKGLTVTDDSRSIVTVQTNVSSNVWVARAADGSDAELVTSGSSRYFGVAWAPGGRIVYSSLSSGNPDIWVMDGDGANARQLTVDENVDRDPVLSRDGHSVYFSSNRSGRYQIWRIGLDESKAVRITDGDDDEFPSCSPDGRWVAYQRLESGFPSIWKVPVDGGAPVQLTQSYSNWPSVSADSQWVACMLWESEKQVYAASVVSINGGASRWRFTIPTLEAPMLSWQRIRWTSDGQGFTYIDDRGDTSNLWLQTLDGRSPRQLTTFRSDRLFDYDVAPDGSIVCTRGPVTSDAVLIRNFAAAR